MTIHVTWPELGELAGVYLFGVYTRTFAVTLWKRWRKDRTAARQPELSDRA